MKVVSVEEQYQEYLKMVKLDESVMHHEQKKQLRETFFAAFATFIQVLKTLSEKSDEEAVEVLEEIEKQVEEFWTPYVENGKI